MFRDTYVGYGVGPVEQIGTVFNEIELRDEARNLARNLNDEAMEEFMSSVKFIGIHVQPRESEWLWCPLKPMEHYCAGCSQIFIVQRPTDFITGFGA
jgi:hypothetical protein